jgi:hypothetical protein
MHAKIYLYDFQDAFNKVRPSNFSREGQEVLFNYLEELEQDIGESLEFDVIALCCDYAEMTLNEVIYSYGLESDTTFDECHQWIAEQTALCGIADPSFTEQKTFVFQQF